MNPERHLDSPRVFAAADALLAAVRSSAGKNAVLEVIFPSDRPVVPDDDNPDRFSADELVLAMDFLIRAGFMDE